MGGFKAVDKFLFDTFGREFGKTAGRDFSQAHNFSGRYVTATEHQVQRLLGTQQTGVR